MAPDSSERRRHKRQNVKGSLIIYNEKMYAEVVDISLGGLSCRSRVNPRKMFSPVLDVEILDRASGKYIKDLSGILIRCAEQAVPGKDTKEIILNFGIEFKNMTDEKKQLLDQFIQSSLPSENQNPTFN